MGARICFTNHVHIANKSFKNGVMEFIGYKDISPELIEEIVNDKKIKWIQISENLPEQAYQIIDSILERREDLYFRIFHIIGDNTFDISFLGSMPHLTRVWLDGHLRENKQAVNYEYLCELPNLKGLHLDLFDCRDYSFINNLSPKLEELILFADSMSGTVKFDCQWLLQYKELYSLFLGKKAKKNFECINQISTLKNLSLRGIKVQDFSFLKALHLESFALLWCSNTDLSGIGELQSLRELELWRIMKLDNLEFISSLVNLETLRLIDLKHITTLPDLSKLKKLANIKIDNVPIDLDTLDEPVRNLIHP